MVLRTAGASLTAEAVGNYLSVTLADVDVVAAHPVFLPRQMHDGLERQIGP